jgi:predicted dehydrogenase
MRDRARVAVIGAGAMGSNHIRVYSELADAELVAVADSDEARLGEIGVRAYTDYRRMLEEEQLDAVSIAVPARAHHDAALACIDRGIATLIEKPIAASAMEGASIRTAAETRSVALMVGHIERFNPAVQQLKKCIDDGVLGAIYQASAWRVGPFFKRERDVGVCHDLATHDIDVLQHVLGTEVVEVHAETRSGIKTAYEDMLAGILLFGNGAFAQVEANWLSPKKERGLVLLGERGMLTLDYITRSAIFYEGDGDRESTGEPIAVPGADVEPLRAELAAFLRAVKGEEAVSISAEDAIVALRVADALVEAGRSGRPVALQAARALP